MISYDAGGWNYIGKLLQVQGSVFPSSLVVALPCASLAVFLKIMMREDYFGFISGKDSIMSETQAWSGFSFLVGFLIVFRTSQAYNRFWDGCTATHQMRAEWFDACSALVSFCRHSKAQEDLIMRFKNTLIRLFSMLHAAALAELEELNADHDSFEDIKAFSFTLIDPCGIDDDSLRSVKESSSKVELIFEWIQLLIVENIDTDVLSIPAPILSRAFQEIANGMVAFHDAMKISYIPFPFPYAQTCDALLVFHWLICPFVTTQWVTFPVWAFIIVFIQVFILWSLNFIAVEIENPFGTDANDLDGRHMQREMNSHLLLLLQPATVRVPQLSSRATWSRRTFGTIQIGQEESFLDVWRLLDAKFPEDMSKPTVGESGRKGNKYTRAAAGVVKRISQNGFFGKWNSLEPSMSAMSLTTTPSSRSDVGARSGQESVRYGSQTGLGSVCPQESTQPLSSGAAAAPRDSYSTSPDRDTYSSPPSAYGNHDLEVGAHGPPLGRECLETCGVWEAVPKEVTDGSQSTSHTGAEKPQGRQNRHVPADINGSRHPLPQGVTGGAVSMSQPIAPLRSRERLGDRGADNDGSPGQSYM